MTSSDFRYDFRTRRRSSHDEGVIHGKTIELEWAPGLPDGQEVTVTVEAAAAPKSAGEGLRRSAGAWSDDPRGLDEYLKWTRRQRKIARPELEP